MQSSRTHAQVPFCCQNLGSLIWSPGFNTAKVKRKWCNDGFLQKQSGRSHSIPKILQGKNQEDWWEIDSSSRNTLRIKILHKPVFCASELLQTLQTLQIMSNSQLWDSANPATFTTSPSKGLSQPWDASQLWRLYIFVAWDKFHCELLGINPHNAAQQMGAQENSLSTPSALQSPSK